MYSKTNWKPNKSDVTQILDLEFEARRAFIDSDATKGEDRAAKIMDAYPCFKDPRHISHFEPFNILADTSAVLMAISMAISSLTTVQ